MAISPLEFPYIGFTKADGKPLSNGYVLIRLNKDTYFDGGQVCGGTSVRVDLDESGAMVDTPHIWPNGMLWPPGSLYIFSSYTNEGEQVYENVGVSIGGTMGAYVLTNPTTSQTITQPYINDPDQPDFGHAIFEVVTEGPPGESSGITAISRAAFITDVVGDDTTPGTASFSVTAPGVEGFGVSAFQGTADIVTFGAGVFGFQPVFVSVPTFVMTFNNRITSGGPIMLVDASVGNVVITLPSIPFVDALPPTTMLYTFKRVDPPVSGTPNIVTINGGGATIDGVSTYTLSNPLDWVKILGTTKQVGEDQIMVWYLVGHS